MLIADRYLPDRSINVIAQRYSKLSILVFRAHGINIDAEGNLEVPPKHEGVEKVDPEKVELLKKVAPPAILNVHRWSIEEDLTLLRAVPVMGHMWAELSTRLLPHRDRGHLRKRYQVLERRIKATITRAQREDGAGSKPPKPPKISTQKAAAARPASSLPPRIGDQTLNPTRFQPPGAKKRKVPVPPFPPNPPTSSVVWHAYDSLSMVARGPVPAHLLRPPPPPPQGANGSRMPVPNVAPKPRRNPLGYSLPIRAPPGGNRSKADERSVGMNLDAHMDAQHNETNTRLGFEKILNEASNEWSQMSRVKEMMENDTESMIATTIVHKLAKGSPLLHPGINVSHDRSAHDAVDRLQGVAIEDGESSSGMSTTINESERSQSYSSPLKKRSRGHFMSSVMEGSQKKTKSEKSEDASTNNHHGEEKKESAGDIAMRPPLTPLRGPAGTPLGFSRMAFSPALKAGFSPAPAAARPSYSPGVNSLLLAGTNGASMDGFEYCNFDISERSHQAFSEGISATTPLKSFPTMPPPTLGHPLTPSRALFQDTNSHSLLASDFDAITALNSLSNSPARSLLRKPTSQTFSAPEENPRQKKSLFARVVGGVEDKRKRSANNF
jgi:hypothetical protein